MRKEGVRFLLASVGFTLSLGTPGVLATSAAAAISTKPAELPFGDRTGAYADCGRERPVDHADPLHLPARGEPLVESPLAEFGNHSQPRIDEPFEGTLPFGRFERTRTAGASQIVAEHANH